MPCLYLIHVWEDFPLFLCSMHSVYILPSSYQPDKLVRLEMRFSKLRQIWKEKKDLKELKYLDLWYCRNLIEIPDLTSAPNLEKLVLEGCGSLSELRPSVWTHKRLQHLILRRCLELRSFPGTIEMASLRTLDLGECVKLEKFPEVCNMERLETLSLDGTSLGELPSSVRKLTGLKILRLTECIELKSLPSSIWKLKSLEELDLSHCFELKRLPELYNMQGLKRLNLSIPSLKELPSSVVELTGLKFLGMKNSGLKSLPSSIWKLKSLETLDLSYSDIEEVPSSIGGLTGLRRLRLTGCEYLKSLPSSICKLKSLELLDLFGCSSLEELPEIFGGQESMLLDEADGLTFFWTKSLFLEARFHLPRNV